MISDRLVAGWVDEVRIAYEVGGVEQAQLVLNGIANSWGSTAVGFILGRLAPATAGAISAGQGGAT